MQSQTATDGAAGRQAQRWHELTLILTFLASGFYAGVGFARHVRDIDSLEAFALFAWLAALALSCLIWLAKVRGRLP